MVPEWVKDAVFYQIFPERFANGDPSNDPPGTQPWGGTPDRDTFFGGDLRGIIQKLDYLQDLGVNALYLNPIFKAGTNHKYDTHDYFQIDPAFGDQATFDELVRELHARDMRIILDGVFNHCGDGFGPFRDLWENGEQSQYKEWFTPYSFPLTKSPHPNYGTCGNCAYLPRLNCHNPEVEAFIHKVALHWLERGIDGWRLDVPYEIHPEFWRRFRQGVKAKYPDAYLVAEEWRDPFDLLQGDTFDGAMHYRLRELCFDFIIKNALTADAFARGLQMLMDRTPQDAQAGMLTLLGSHDTARVLTECGGNVESVKLLYTLLLTLPGVPMIYYGDENGMEGANDPDCRRPMVWNESAWNQDIRQHVQYLLHVRGAYPELRWGAFKLLHAEDRLVVYERTLNTGTMLIAVNNSYAPRTVRFQVDLPGQATLTDLLTQEHHALADLTLNLGLLSPRTTTFLTVQ